MPLGGVTQRHDRAVGLAGAGEGETERDVARRRRVEGAQRLQLLESFLRSSEMREEIRQLFARLEHGRRHRNRAAKRRQRRLGIAGAALAQGEKEVRSPPCCRRGR